MDRVEAALAATPPQGALLELARELRDGAMPQAELLALFDAARERHARDADETNYEAIMDTMDLIAGWCAPSQGLYPIPNSRRDLRAPARNLLARTVDRIPESAVAW